jgi:Pentapeptide repeats (8 copies)
VETAGRAFDRVSQQRRSNLDLSRFAWTGEDFTDCDLHGANLNGCNFTGANFERAELWNADLSGSDLTGVTNLLPKQLAATNLESAKLPDSLTKFEALEASAKLADNASKVFLTMLGAVAFTFLTLATTESSIDRVLRAHGEDLERRLASLQWDQQRKSFFPSDDDLA